MQWVVWVLLMTQSHDPAAGGGLASTGKGRRLMLPHSEKLIGAAGTQNPNGTRCTHPESLSLWPSSSLVQRKCRQQQRQILTERRCGAQRSR